VDSAVTKLNNQAMLAWRDGRTDDLIAISRQIDARGPEILVEYDRQVPQGVPVSNLISMNARALVMALSVAQRRIGQSYEGSGQDAAAARWYEKANATAAHFGGYDPPASTLLGFMYANGRGVPRDKTRAAELFHHSESAYLASRGSNANPLIYLMDHNQLPQRPSDLTVAMVRQAEDNETAEKVINFLIVAGLMSGGRRSQPSASTSTTETRCYQGGASTACTFRMSP
jgi:hypothetical protein